jgi:hypothetical protein
MILKSQIDFLIYVRRAAFNNIRTTGPISVKLDFGSHFNFGVILIVLGATLRKVISFVAFS